MTKDRVQARFERSGCAENRSLLLSWVADNPEEGHAAMTEIHAWHVAWATDTAIAAIEKAFQECPEVGEVRARWDVFRGTDDPRDTGTRVEVWANGERLDFGAASAPLRRLIETLEDLPTNEAVFRDLNARFAVRPLQRDSVDAFGAQHLGNPWLSRRQGEDVPVLGGERVEEGVWSFCLPHVAANPSSGHEVDLLLREWRLGWITERVLASAERVLGDDPGIDVLSIDWSLTHGFDGVESSITVCADGAESPPSVEALLDEVSAVLVGADVAVLCDLHERFSSINLHRDDVAVYAQQWLGAAWEHRKAREEAQSLENALSTNRRPRARARV